LAPHPIPNQGKAIAASILMTCRVLPWNKKRKTKNEEEEKKTLAYRRKE
jgi:hypothetical protein